MRIWIILLTLLSSANISVAQPTNFSLSNKKTTSFITINLPEIVGFVGRLHPTTTQPKRINLSKRKQATLSFFTCLIFFLGYLQRKEKRLTKDSPLFFTPKNR